jgi:hypothetical protein
MTENILDTKYNEIKEIEKKYKLFIIKLHILLLLIDTDNITDEDKETIKKYVEEKIEIKHRIFQLYSDIDWMHDDCSLSRVSFGLNAGGAGTVPGRQPTPPHLAPVAQLSAPVAQLSAPVAQFPAPAAQPSAPVAQLSAPAAQLSLIWSASAVSH